MYLDMYMSLCACARMPQRREHVYVCDCYVHIECICTYVNACKLTFVRIRILRMYVCMYACTHACMYANTYIHTRAHMHKHTRNIHVYTYM